MNIETNQLSLFSPRRLARRTDPITSHQAAAGSKSTRATHWAVIERLLQRYPDSTYQELFARHVADQSALGRGLVIPDAPSLMRRLSELAVRGDRRTCRETGKGASTWRLE